MLRLLSGTLGFTCSISFAPESVLFSVESLSLLYKFYFYTDHSKAVLLLWVIYVVSVLFLLCFSAHLFIDA